MILRFIFAVIFTKIFSFDLIDFNQGFVISFKNNGMNMPWALILKTCLTSLSYSTRPEFVFHDPQGAANLNLLRLKHSCMLINGGSSGKDV